MNNDNEQLNGAELVENAAHAAIASGLGLPVASRSAAPVNGSVVDSDSDDEWGVADIGQHMEVDVPDPESESLALVL